MRKKIGYIICIFILIIGVLYLFHKDSSNMSKVVLYQGNNLMISIDGNSSSTLPTSGNYYLVRYDCKSKDTVLEWNRGTYQLNVSNSNKKGGVSCFLDFQSNPKLADMSQGSYVAYTGNNGCIGEACTGQNANYVSDTDMGYCYSSHSKFIVNGWRLAYSKGGSPYLISAGAPECMCTSSDGTSSSTSCNSYETTSGAPQHIANLNRVGLKYCNQNYTYGGVCDESTSWAMSTTDFQNIMKNALSLGSCYLKHSDRSCGYTNDLIDNGEYYWYATPSSTMAGAFNWNPNYRHVNRDNSNYRCGVRPVLRLESSVSVTSGSGTYEDPYQIINNTFMINSGSKYVGNAEKSAIPLTLIGNNISQMCINVNSSGCSNYIEYNRNYTLDWSSEEDGEKIVYVYYKDSAGNIIASMNRKIILDTVGPTNNRVTIEDASGLTRQLTIVSTDADKMCFSNTSSNVSDCTDWVNYAASHKWRLSSGTGSKNVYAFFKDKAGNVSSTTATVNVTSIVEFYVSEEFSDTTYDSNITVTAGATYPWTVSNGRFQSTNQGQNSTTSTSTIQFTPTYNATLSFDYGVSSEANYDELTITLTGSDSSSNTLVNAISGINNGSKAGITLTSGVTYTLTLTYTKDSGADNNDDVGYIDNLVIES